MTPNLPSPNPDPQRRCVSCRGLFPRSQLWRVVRLAGGRGIQLDQGMGRSAYLCQRWDCLRQARRKQRLSHALKTAVPPQVYDELEQRLQQQLPGP
ncbi:MAG: YlxR family protein [Thermostichales cyanobacterium DRC_bins_46]